MAKKVDPFAKAIHDLCVLAGAKCGARCDQGTPKANTSVQRAAQLARPRRRNLTVAEAGRMCRNGR